MGRPFLEKYAAVEWEVHQEAGAGGGGYADNDPDPVGQGEDTKALKKWKDGMTGFPVVDAAMRCLKQTGWVHNRFRMIAAMFLTKDLMIDWRVGERVSVILHCWFWCLTRHSLRSISWSSLSTQTLHRITEAGSGVQAQVRSQE